MCAAEVAERALRPRRAAQDRGAGEPPGGRGRGQRERGERRRDARRRAAPRRPRRAPAAADARARRAARARPLARGALAGLRPLPAASVAATIEPADVPSRYSQSRKSSPRPPRARQHAAQPRLAERAAGAEHERVGKSDASVTSASRPRRARRAQADAGRRSVARRRRARARQEQGRVDRWGIGATSDRGRA